MRVDLIVAQLPGEYGFYLDIHEGDATRSGYHRFDSRDERQAAILTLCERAIAEGFELTIS